MMRFGDYFPYLFTEFNNTLFPIAWGFITLLSIPTLTIMLGIIFWPLWLAYIRAKNFFKMKYVVVEVKLPKEIAKSPKAMELFLHSIHNTSDGEWPAVYLKGETRPWYSLELISVEGRVKFMIWTEDQRKIGLMSALYAQFPGIEINEVEDYTKGIQYDPKTMKMWIGEFKFTKDDPYPIKTYIDYGLDKDPKEEFKVDPLIPVLEFLGSVGPNQQVWMQFIVRAHKAEQKKLGTLFGKTDSWKDKAEELKNKIMMRDTKTKIAGKLDKVSGRTTPPTLSEGEKDIVVALDRSITKLPFDVGIRTVYFGKRESYNTPFGMGGLISSMKQFNTEHLNGFRPNGDMWTGPLKFPWQDFKDIRKTRALKGGLLAYKMRSFFYPPFDGGKQLILNTEELATIYHFPGAAALTPTLDRLPSKKSGAPANLPI